VGPTIFDHRIRIVDLRDLSYDFEPALMHHDPELRGVLKIQGKLNLLAHVDSLERAFMGRDARVIPNYIDQQFQCLLI